ncbi:MAG: hypothetical protein BGO43_01725 [Gammaproteobacteria bacterium 39-13]|nr:MAG: hypothetical protein BGO43_01725 [Gammaproteobacteria bacterium 39-13]
MLLKTFGRKDLKFNRENETGTKMIKKIFWNGIKAFVPIALTISIVIWLFTSMEAFFGHFLRRIVPPQYYFDGIGIIVGVALIFVIGILVNAWMVKKVYALAERLVKRIPFVKSIYNATQELLDFFDKDKQNAQQAVLVETHLGRIVGFITRDSLSSLTPSLGNDDDVLVYIPLSYMVGGISIVAPKSTLTPLAWPVDKAMSFILTAGMTGQKNNSQK